MAAVVKGRCCVQLLSKTQFIFSAKRFSTTPSVLNSKRNFRKFPYFDRGTSKFNHKQRTNPDPNLPSFQYGRPPGYFDENYKLVVIPEMVPELIVPDLTGFNLKPYVSYRAPDAEVPEFTAKDLFYCVYSEKIERDFESGSLLENGEPRDPSDEELLTPEGAREAAFKIGADMFTDEENIVNDCDWMKEQPKLPYN